MSDCLVLDTNIVLDLYLFNDGLAASWRASVEAGQWQCLATLAMRDELARVLTYKQLQPRMAYYQVTAEDLLAKYDAHVQLVAAAAKATVTCSDADDQKFIDLAVAHRACLLSKDNAVLSMKKRLLPLGVQVLSALPAASTAV